MSNPSTPVAQVDPSEGPFEDAQAFDQEGSAAAEADGEESAAGDESDDSDTAGAE
jgi:hypothetical protein